MPGNASFASTPSQVSTDMSKNKVVDVLDYYGCKEIHIQGEWRSHSEVEEAFGTTHEMYVRLQDEPLGSG